MKKISLLLLSLIAMFSIVNSASADGKTVKETSQPSSILSTKETAYLKQKVGLSDTDISVLPIDLLRVLILKNGKLIGHGNQQYNLNSEGQQNSNQSDFATASLTASDLTMGGYGFATTSDWAGKKEILLYGYFDWNVNPINKFTDGLSIGFPATNKFFYKFSAQGTVMNFQSQYQDWNPTYEQWTLHSKYVPDSWDNGLGVGTKIDLLAGRTDHKGNIWQDAYCVNTETGTSNVKIRYGHTFATGTPTFSLYPAGLAVTPAFNNEILDFGFTINW